MKYDDWLPWYRRILRAFGFSKAKDETAVDILSQLLPRKTPPLNDLRELMQGKRALILGAGPSLEIDLEQAVKFGYKQRCILVCADGATAGAIKAGLIPQIVVTDLDGSIQAIKTAHDKGAFIVLHAHGDNIPRLKRYAGLFDRVIGSTQTKKKRNVFNFGGFTDGDRCVFLNEHLAARQILLAGMDFGQQQGKFSKPYLRRHQQASERKLLKNYFARQLLYWLSGWAKAEILNLTSSGNRIPGIRNTSWKEIF